MIVSYTSIAFVHPAWLVTLLGRLSSFIHNLSQPAATLLSAIIATIGVALSLRHSRRTFKINLRAETVRAGMEIVWDATNKYHELMNHAKVTAIATSREALAEKYTNLWALQFNQFYYWKANLIPDGIYRSWMMSKRDWIMVPQPGNLADLPVGSFHLIRTFHDGAFELFMRQVFSDEKMSTIMKRAKRRKVGRLGWKDRKKLIALRQKVSPQVLVPVASPAVPSAPPPATGPTP